MTYSSLEHQKDRISLDFDNQLSKLGAVCQVNEFTIFILYLCLLVFKRDYFCVSVNILSCIKKFNFHNPDITDIHEFLPSYYSLCQCNDRLCYRYVTCNRFLYNTYLGINIGEDWYVDLRHPSDCYSFRLPLFNSRRFFALAIMTVLRWQWLPVLRPSNHSICRVCTYV